MYQADNGQHAQSTTLQRRRPYAVRVRHTHSRCTAVADCVYRSQRSVIHHLVLFAAAAVCVTDPRTLEEMQGPFGLSMSTPTVLVSMKVG